MKQTGEPMTLGGAAQRGHDQLLMIRRDVGGFMNRSNLKLAGCNFVVSGLGGNPQSVELTLHVLHEHLHSFRNRSEIVIIKLLTLG